MEYTIESVTNPEFFFIRLDVYVGCFLTDRIHKNFVYKAHHRGIDLGIFGARDFGILSSYAVEVVILIQVGQF